jgi:hypothetical protein
MAVIQATTATTLNPLASRKEAAGKNTKWRGKLAEPLPTPLSLGDAQNNGRITDVLVLNLPLGRTSSGEHESWLAFPSFQRSDGRSGLMERLLRQIKALTWLYNWRINRAKIARLQSYR